MRTHRSQLRAHFVVMIAAALVSLVPTPRAGTIIAQTRGLSVPAADRQSSTKGRDYALLFATNTYDDPRWPPLQNPIFDATTIKTELETSYAFDSVELVVDPPLSQIRGKLRAYAERPFGEHDQLFIFLAVIHRLRTGSSKRSAAPGVTAL